MENEFRILTECYIDFMLMQAIMGISPNDQHAGINAIGKNLKQNYIGKKAVILIDNDKLRAPFLKEYLPIRESKEFKIIVFRHRKDSHYAVQISPASETWILEVCQKSRIDLSKYRLPNTAKKLADITKSTHAFKDSRLQQLMNTLKQKNPEHFKFIRSFINDVLVEKKLSSSKRKK